MRAIPVDRRVNQGSRHTPRDRFTQGGAMTTRPATLLLALLPWASAAAMERADTTRVRPAPTTVEARTGDANKVVKAVGERLTEFLTGPTLGVQPLSSRLTSQVRTEAHQANCRY